MLTGLAHVDIVCRDLDASLAFYRAVLGPLGLGATTFEPIGERGETIHYLRFPGENRGSLGLRAASGPEADSPFELYAPGLHHLALGNRAGTGEDQPRVHGLRGAGHGRDLR